VAIAGDAGLEYIRDRHVNSFAGHAQQRGPDFLFRAASLIG
jgi:hypothetical protein